MKSFLIGLQFLTRIHVVRQVEWQPESFGRSVKYFPLVGAVLGAVLSAVGYGVGCYLPLISSYLPINFSAVLLVVLSIYLTGGLHCDGLMDTADGLFSGRQQERILEIMKDSRVGSNGVIAFGCLFFLKWSLLMDMATTIWPQALFVMPVLGRFAMVIGITAFPYARNEGIGKAFVQYADRKSLHIAFLFTVLLLLPFGVNAFIGLGLVVLFTIIFARYVVTRLGGLTGDVYGAITEGSEVIVLCAYLFGRV